MNYLDLFSGIGGFALGARWAGMEFERHYNSDIDDYANRVYAKHFPGAIQLGDITKIKAEDLPDGEWIITGGFPCQDISIAGKGAGLDGQRSGLWFEYWRLIRDIRPQFAIMENVGALTFRGLDRVLGSLAEIGYNAEWQDIRAEDVGAPHKRERIWIVAYSELYGCSGCKVSGGIKETIREEQTRKNRAQHIEGTSILSEAQRNVADTNKTGPQKKGAEQQAEGIAGSSEQISNASSEGLERQKSERRSGGEQGLFAECSQWSTEPCVGRVANGIPSRVDRLKCLGNSIVPQIAEVLFSRIKYLLESEPRKASQS